MNKSLTNNIKYNHICNYTYIKVEREKRKGVRYRKKPRTAVVRSGLECMKTSSEHSTVGTVHVGPSFCMQGKANPLRKVCILHERARRRRTL